MSKRNKVLLGVYAFVYVFALIIFHVTYRYPMYWEDESTIIIVGSLIYFIIGFISYLALNRHTSMIQFSDVSVKKMTLIVACASVLKTFVCICMYNSDILFIEHFHGNLLFNMICWMLISVSFFTLYRNMR